MNYALHFRFIEDECPNSFVNAKEVKDIGIFLAQRPFSTVRIGMFKEYNVWQSVKLGDAM